MTKTITLISLNFHPEDTAIGLYSTQMALHLKASGFKVQIITAFPYYPQWKIANSYKDKPAFYQETWQDMQIYRYKQYTPAAPTFLKRVWHIIDFTWGTYFNLNKIKDTDIVFSIIPFTASAWLGQKLAKRKNAKHWVHIQDFEFDAAFQTGLASDKGRSKGFLHNQLSKLESRILNKADCVSTISTIMLEKLKSKTNTSNYLLPNWIDPNSINPETATAHPFFKTPKFKILYAGNIGDKQNWALFKALLKLLNPAHYEIVVVGAGAQAEHIKKLAITWPHLSVFKPIPLANLNSLLCTANAHFLFQKQDIIDTVMPSKILGMMASARPSIITGNAFSEVRTIIESAQGGYYNTKPDAKEIASQFETLRRNTNQANTMGLAARKYIVQEFSKTKILNNLKAQLEEF